MELTPKEDKYTSSEAYSYGAITQQSAHENEKQLLQVARTSTTHNSTARPTPTFDCIVFFLTFPGGRLLLQYISQPDQRLWVGRIPNWGTLRFIFTEHRHPRLAVGAVDKTRSWLTISHSEGHLTPAFLQFSAQKCLHLHLCSAGPSIASFRPFIITGTRQRNGILVERQHPANILTNTKRNHSLFLLQLDYPTMKTICGRNVRSRAACL
jgi:hypothetical protein